MADTVLIVDDEPLVLNVLSEMLEDNNFAVLKAKNADQALELAADRRDISLVLTDVNLPTMNGIELVGMLADRHPEIRLIVMSREEAPIDHAIHDKATFLLKPFTCKQLLRSVNVARR